MPSKNIPVNGWPQIKDLEAVQPTLDRLDKIEVWKRTVKEETFTGDDFIIPNALKLPARSLKTTIEPIQDLHGYDHPWAGGSDINLLNPAIQNGQTTYNNVTYKDVTDGDGNVISTSITGTASDYAQLNIPVSLPAGRYKTNVVLTNNTAEMTVRNASQGWLANPNTEFTLAEATMVYIRYAVISGNTANCIITCMLYAYSGTDKAFRPYSNLCPISGRDSVTITVEGVSA